jgi:hypothetical protein
MLENKCCPCLRVSKASKNNYYNRFSCSPKVKLPTMDKYLLNSAIINNEWVKIFCMSDFKKCKYYPNNKL